ncbi:AI-2E family transporter [Defluviitalea phaphyphila]|uniref:AI-2E family transporter n=1 Tax=Defluviitalea phaphyphila TaxID=1473580 RepID=UPI0007316E30|nr:AI-2E family transporter [Defluviitalea phaphyphila]
MKLPWDKQYLKISFHVIFTLLVILGLGFIIINFIPITIGLSSIISKILSLFSPFFIGVVIAYLLDPIVNIYQEKVIKPISLKLKNSKNISRKKNNIKYKVKNTRTFATLLTYITIILIIILIGILLSTSIGSHKGFKSMDNLINSIKAYTQSFNNIISDIQQNLDRIGFLQEVENTIYDFTNKLGELVQNVTAKIIDGITKAGNQVINFAMALVISFYLLKDKSIFLNLSNQFFKIILPQKTFENIKNYLSDIDHVLSAYIRGQLTDSLIMGILIGISVAIIGIDFPIIIGIIAGIANIIPYFGPIIGMIPAVLMGLISDNPMKALYAIITLFILQQIDGAIIAPKIVGESVDVHPIAIIISITVGGSLFGLMGMLLAVPAAALLKLLLIRFMNKMPKA